MLAPLRHFDRFQRRHRGLALVVAIVKKASEDGAGPSSAMVAYYGFLSLFPLLLAAVAILGFVVHSDASARQTLLNSGLGEIPFFGSLKQDNLAGSGVGVAVGLAVALWAGLGVTLALQRAFNMVYCVPYRRRANFLTSRLRGARLLLLIGALELVATGLTGAVSTALHGVALVIAGVVGSLAVNGGLVAIAFRVLTDDRIPTRELWPGVFLATAGWELLQALGGIYVAHVLHKANTTYGSFAEVIGLLAWLILGARVVVYSAELNVVLARHYWPRGLFEPQTQADRDVRTALAEMEQRVSGESIDVRF